MNLCFSFPLTSKFLQYFFEKNRFQCFYCNFTWSITTHWRCFIATRSSWFIKSISKTFWTAAKTYKMINIAIKRQSWEERLHFFRTSSFLFLKTFLNLLLLWNKTSGIYMPHRLSFWYFLHKLHLYLFNKGSQRYKHADTYRLIYHPD